MATPLLDTDGTPSMATMFMTSHHGFRRDIAAFARALATADTARYEALREEWSKFCAALHHHHTIEDTSMFPDLRAKRPDLAAALDELDEQHRAIAPLLDRGDQLFADLATSSAAARSLVGELNDHLAKHLDAEELVVVPTLRAVKQFPLPPGDEVAAMFADGFAWSTAGLSSEVIEKVCAMLPPAVRDRLPAAREAFEARCMRVWGQTPAGSSVTSVPAS